MKLASYFSGIGAFEKALDRMKINYELVNFCEFDKYAVKSYCAIHGVDGSKNLGDITKVDKEKLEKNIDLLTYGFPCQDISLAGKQKGMINEDGSLTRSGLFFEALGIIETTKPKVAIAENVKNLTSKKFASQFEIVLHSLEDAGYNNYWKVLNAKDYGIPQNRERVFIVSIRKDIDTGSFEFPEGFQLELRLKDVLESVVDEKFYLSNEYLKRYKQSNLIMNGEIHITGTTVGTGQGTNSRHWVHETDGIVGALSATDYKQPKQIADRCLQVGTLDIKGQDIVKRVYSDEGLSPTLTNMQGGNRQPKVLIPQATKQGYAECEVGGVADLSFPNSSTRRGRVQEGGTICPTITAESNGLCRIEEPFIAASRGRNPENPSDRTAGSPTVQRLEPNSQGLCNTLTTVQKDNYVVEPQLRIRKLTPKECFRLMGFDDSDFEKAQKLNSNTQLYKQAGNSIVVNVLECLFRSLFEAIPSLINQEKEKKEWN